MSSVFQLLPRDILNNTSILHARVSIIHFVIVIVHTVMLLTKVYCYSLWKHPTVDNYFRHVEINDKRACYRKY